jgi:hypothetical protein
MCGKRQLIQHHIAAQMKKQRPANTKAFVAAALQIAEINRPLPINIRPTLIGVLGFFL